MQNHSKTLKDLGPRKEFNLWFQTSSNLVESQFIAGTILPFVTLFLLVS